MLDVCIFVHKESDWKPCVGQSFKTFSEFEKLLEDYKRTFTQWVIGHSRSAELENKYLQMRNATLIDPAIKYKYLTYTCKSGGKDRTGTGNGIRVNQR